MQASSPPSLRELQQLFSDGLLRPTTAAQASLSRHLCNEGLPAAQRLQVHRHTIQQALTTSLQLIFPAVQALVGADFFAFAATEFAHAHPPRHGWLDDYGDAFPAFIAAFKPAAGLPYLAELAQLERLVNQVLRAPDEPHCDAAALALLDEADAMQVRFAPRAAFRLLAVRQSIDQLWAAVLADDSQALHTLDLDDGPAWLFVSREAEGLVVQRVPAHAWQFAHALCQGEPVGAAAAGVADAAPALLQAHLLRRHFRAFFLSSQT